MEVPNYFVTKLSNFKYISNMEALSPLEFSDHFSLYIPLYFTECHNEEAEQLTDKLFWDKKKTISLLNDLNDKRQIIEDLFSHVSCIHMTKYQIKMVMSRVSQF